MGGRTCDVHTRLKSTNANVCTNHAKARSLRRRPKSAPAPSESTICGTKLVSGERSAARQGPSGSPSS